MSHPPEEAPAGGGEGAGGGRQRYKFIVLLALYFAQGLPWKFLAIAFPVVMRRSGVGLEYIGLFSLITLPGSVKLLWAPYVDRWGSSRVGHYKSWIFPLQLATFACVVAMSWLDPQSRMPALVALVLVFSLLAATQDIGCDGLAVRALDVRERPLGNTIATVGMVLGTLVGGAVTLWLLDHVGWSGSMLVLATTLLVPLAFLWPYREPAVSAAERRAVSLASIWRMFQRPGMTPWILLMSFFLFGSAFVNPMVQPLLVDQGLSNSQIGVVLGVVEPAATVPGLLLVPPLMRRLGRGRALVAFGLFQAFAMALYVTVALGWLSFWGICVVYGLEGFAGGLVLVAVYTVCMDKSEHATAGSDFTTQFSIMILLRRVPLALSGVLAAAVGYAGLFVIGVGIYLLAIAAFAVNMDRVRLVDEGVP